MIALRAFGLIHTEPLGARSKFAVGSRPWIKVASGYATDISSTQAASASFTLNIAADIGGIMPPLWLA